MKSTKMNRKQTRRIKSRTVFISVSPLILRSRNLSHLSHGEVFNIETVYASPLHTIHELFNLYLSHKSRSVANLLNRWHNCWGCGYGLSAYVLSTCDTAPHRMHACN